MSYEAARPVWAEIDLGAVTHNVELLRSSAGRPVKILAPVKANAYGHGVERIGLHLQDLGVEGLATANIDHAIAARAAGVTIPILLYGSQLPEGIDLLLEHGLTPTIYSEAGLRSVSGRDVAVHVKVDAGLRRLGVALDEAEAFIRTILAEPGVRLEGLYTHVAYGSQEGEDASRHGMAAFAALVRRVEAEHGITIEFAQGAASSVIAGGFPDPLNTIAPGHLVYGLHPLQGARAERLGFRKALTALRARLIHVDRRPAGVILFGMDNGYRPPADGRTVGMLCGGQRCRVLSVSAEYTVIDLGAVPDAAVGDVVTVIGDGIDVEDVAAALGAPSAAYWLVGLRNVPLRYRCLPPAEHHG
jgi:alanine racemase